MTTISSARVAVIGSGISGIASAAMLQKNGFQVQIFEKSTTIGGIWALAYPEVRLQNIASQYHISDFPWPFQPDLHPTGAQIMQYLSEAVRHFRLQVHLQHEIEALHEKPDGWELVVNTPTGEETLFFDYVLVSNGHYNEGKNALRFPGQELFQGTVVTEREAAPLERFRGKRVAVVGFGKSAVDMAEFAVKHGAQQVYHVFRTARWMLPRRLFGMHFTRILFNRFGTVMMPAWAHPSGPERLMHAHSAGFIGAFWKQIQGIFTRKILNKGRKLGPEAEKRLRTVVPEHPLTPDFRSAACLEPERYYEYVASGRIEPVHSGVEGFYASGLLLQHGRTVDCDIAVLSLGNHSPAFPFLPEKYRYLLEAEPDGAQLYRHLIHPGIPRLGFAGYNHGFLHVPAVEVGALWLAALWKGEMALPAPAQMDTSIARLRAWKRANIHFEPSRSCGVNTRFQQYLDTLLLDLGVSPYRKLPNVFAEVFARYSASDYAAVYRDYERKRKQGRILRPIATLD